MKLSLYGIDPWLPYRSLHAMASGPANDHDADRMRGDRIRDGHDDWIGDREHHSGAGQRESAEAGYPRLDEALELTERVDDDTDEAVSAEDPGEFWWRCALAVLALFGTAAVIEVGMLIRLTPTGARD